MTQILIEGYELDIYEGIGALFTYQIDNVNTFAKKNTSFSKTIVIPATPNNKKLLGFVDDLNVSSDYTNALPNVLSNFNPAVPANCIVLIDSIQVFKGIIRVLEVTNTNGLIEYECSVFGELGGFYANLTNLYLHNLDFSDYNENWLVSNITNSWDNIIGHGVYYGLGDYGNCSVEPNPNVKTKKNWTNEAFRPAFYVKEYLEKIIDISKYTVDISALTNISWFDKLIIPHNQDELYLPTILRATSSDPNQQYLRAYFNYLNSTTGNLYFDFYVRLKNNQQFASNATVTVELIKNGTSIQSATATWSSLDSIGTQKVLAITYIDVGALNGDIYNFRISCNQLGEFLVDNSVYNLCKIQQTNSSGAVLFLGSFNNTGTTYIQLNTTPAIVNFYWLSNYYDKVQKANYGDPIDMNFAIPKDVKLTDFFGSVLKMFKCVIVEDKDVEKGLKVIPYIDYYYSGATPLDWSSKIDRKTAFKIKPMSELNARYYEFRYDVDSDWINTLYKEKYGIGYGEKVYDSNYEFSKEKSEAKLIFSGTPIFTVDGEQKVFPIFWKSTDNGVTEGRMGTKIRILFAKKITITDSWKLHHGNAHTTISDYYGYMGHYLDPDSGGFDLNWETPRELYFRWNREVPPNLFNSYYSDYLFEITNKDSKLLTCNVYLNKIDIKDLDFSRPIYIDGVLFRLNKVVDYDSEKQGLTKVELLKLNY